MPAIRLDRSIGQGGLVALLAVAFAAILVARLSSGGPNLVPSGVAAGSSETPAASASATATDRATEAPAATPDGAPGRTLVPTEAKPTPSQKPAASDPVEATPAPPAAATTYTVKSGDTLAAIAGEFGTTWQVLAQLNRLEDPTRLKVGQKLDLP